MNNQISSVAAALVSVLIAVVMLGVVAALVSRNAQTPQVLEAGLGGFAGDLSAALSPVSGGGMGYSPYTPGMSFGA